MNCTENILRNATHSIPGWMKIDCNARGATEKVAMTRRSIRVGNTVNCNGEILKNYKIRDYMEDIMRKYNISNYDIQLIDNKYEFSYELTLREDIYNAFSEAIKS